MTTIETARALLASASPELRRAVGELIKYALDVGFDFGDNPNRPELYNIENEVRRFVRELIEDKGRM